MEEEIIKGVPEALKLANKGLEITGALGGFLSRVFGTVPEDVVGVVGGDWLRQVRIRNADRLARKTDEILKERGIEENTKPMSPSVALPLLEAAQDETRDELFDIWARLIANGMDPERSSLIRQSIINVVKAFEPLDAVILQKVSEESQGCKSTIQINDYTEPLGISIDEFELSIQNLVNLDCITHPNRAYNGEVQVAMSTKLTHLGREVIRACKE
ncbi:MAG: DUF4393 domain-containing protein [Candidatus Scalindua sp.]|jgi:hypothetical protein|nr:DUF4393 domain-containing protein [Candidatus Scalindua sp.]MBT6225178.1 DUF4393 domain-containing protein [Candidatus Scalindua sp.]